MPGEFGVFPEGGGGRHFTVADCGEGGPVAPEQENEKSRDDEGEWKPFGGEEDMEEDNTDDRSEDGEAERHEAAED